MELSPCRTLQNRLKTQKCKPRQLNKLSTSFPVKGFPPDTGSSTRPRKIRKHGLNLTVMPWQQRMSVLNLNNVIYTQYYKFGLQVYLHTVNSIQFNSDICTRQLINYHVGARDEHRKHDPQVGDFKKKSEFSI